MSRKIRYFQDQITKSGRTAAYRPLRDKDIGVDELEAKLTDLEAELLEINANTDKLQRTHSELIEFQLVLHKVTDLSFKGHFECTFEQKQSMHLTLKYFPFLLWLAWMKAKKAVFLVAVNDLLIVVSPANAVGPDFSDDVCLSISQFRRASFTQTELLQSCVWIGWCFLQFREECSKYCATKSRY